VVDLNSDDESLAVTATLASSPRVNLVPCPKAADTVDMADACFALRDGQLAETDRLDTGLLSELPAAFAHEGSGQASAGVVSLLPHSHYHLLEFEPAVDLLRGAGVAVHLALADDAPIALRARAAWLGLARLNAPAVVDALIVQNDWRDDVQALAAKYREATPGFTLISKVEGIQDFADADTGRARRAYRNSDRVLCLGPHDQMALGLESDALVGSTRLEAIALRQSTLVPLGDALVVNLNFTYGVFDRAAEGWLRAVTRAAERAGHTAVVSAHPAQPRLRREVAITSRPATFELGQGRRLVSRFSTLFFEALAWGWPPIYFNPHNEAAGAFLRGEANIEQATSEDELVGALTRTPAVLSRHSRMAALAPYVSIDSERSAAERLATAILEGM
jgi:hypothetical protein